MTGSRRQRCLWSSATLPLTSLLIFDLLPIRAGHLQAPIFIPRSTHTYIPYTSIIQEAHYIPYTSISHLLGIGYPKDIQWPVVLSFVLLINGVFVASGINFGILQPSNGLTVNKPRDNRNNTITFRVDIPELLDEFSLLLQLAVSRSTSVSCWTSVQHIENFVSFEYFVPNLTHIFLIACQMIQSY